MKEKEYIIPGKLVGALLNYLQYKPYNEVSQLIAELMSNIKPMPEPPAEPASPNPEPQE